MKNVGTIQELEQAIQAMITEKLEKITHSSEWQALYVGVTGLPDEGLPFDDGVVVFGNKAHPLTYFSTGENGENVLYDNDKPLTEFLREQFINNTHLVEVEKVPLEVLVSTWEVRDLDMYDLIELLKDYVAPWSKR